MSMKRTSRRGFLSILAGTPLLAVGWQNWSFAVGPEFSQWSEVVDKAIRFLQTTQGPDGSFSKDRSLGVTGIVVTGVLETGRISVDDPFVARSLAFIESLVDSKEGHIAGKNPANQ